MDVGTGLALLGTAKIVEKILGPTADYIGQGLKDWTEKRLQNVRRIFDAAERKLGERIEEDGGVPPRVLASILTEGSFRDDPLAAEYFGGVLASSRSGTARDDRGATMAAVVGRLSTYQLRSHYVFYTIFKQVFDGSGLKLKPDERPQMEVFVPYEIYDVAMDFSDDEFEKMSAILDHVLHGLGAEELIRSHYWHADAEHIHAKLSAITEGGIGISPSVLGTQLYLWAHGHSGLDVSKFLEPVNRLQKIDGIEVVPGSKPTGFAPREWVFNRSI